jgi:hypothetical protein
MRIPVASGRAQAVKKCPKAEVTSNFDHLRALRKKAVWAGLMSYKHRFIQK